MKSVCAWCNTVLADGDASEPRPITHGICLQCAQGFLADLAEPMRDFLDRLGVPVLVIDSGAVVRNANAQACELLGKDLGGIQDHRPGDVVECIHSSEPGGCGRQLHCQSCTIRKIVLETHATGRSFNRVPAYPDLQTRDGIKRSRVEISSELVNDLVLLRIHEICEAGGEEIAAD
ncbi:MAG: hypothetical protein KJ060_09070 [Candidatus Hydrogenedentes bacterium]|nr:hypothetical protein [Candidatus Hydrogenedentota bacterium]